MTHALSRAALGAALMLAASGALAADKLKVGFMLPYSGTFAAVSYTHLTLPTNREV